MGHELSVLLQIHLPTVQNKKLHITTKLFLSYFPGGDAGRRGKGAWGCGGTAVGGNYTAGMCNLANSITYGSELALYYSVLAGFFYCCCCC